MGLGIIFIIQAASSGEAAAPSPSPPLAPASADNSADFLSVTLPSILVSVLGVAGGIAGLVKTVSSVIEPVSELVAKYLSLPSHKDKLSYQHAVIRDLQFVLRNAHKRRDYVSSTFWALLDCIAGCLCLDSRASKTAALRRWKQPISSNTRVVVMVDDLDRCAPGNVMEVRRRAAQPAACIPSTPLSHAPSLQLLRAVNLVLAACEVNVVMGVNWEELTKAVAAGLPGENVAWEEAEKFMRKIIQLPIAVSACRRPGRFAMQARMPDVTAVRAAACCYVRGFFRVH